MNIQRTNVDIISRTFVALIKAQQSLEVLAPTPPQYLVEPGAFGALGHETAVGEEQHPFLEVDGAIALLVQCYRINVHSICLRVLAAFSGTSPDVIKVSAGIKGKVSGN